MFNVVKKTVWTTALLLSSVVASDVLVSVNGVPITEEDAESFVVMNAPNQHFAQLPKEQQEMIVDRLIERKLFADLAKEEGVEKNPEYLEALNKVKEDLLVNMLMKLQLENAIVSNSEAKAFYDKNSKKFSQPERVHARHILLSSKEDAQGVIDALKGLKGEALKERFIALAKEKSTGPSASTGGDLGFFTKGQMVPAFSKAVWSLPVGSVSQTPVKTQFGYHVIYVEEKKKASVLPYEKVKAQIVASLKQKQFRERIEELAKGLKAKAKIVKPQEKK
jgi:parvulin-like peptidyl-prolyl isomerase